jgi:parvulin-like peptidyl-prolyl isomerase
VQIEYVDGRLGAEDVVTFLALTGQAGAILNRLARARMLGQRAAQLELQLTDDELQQWADEFRLRNGLGTPAETLAFLERWGVAMEQFEAFCEAMALEEKLRRRLAEPPAVAARFLSHRQEFERALVSVILVADLDLAEELRMRATEDKEDFHQLAVEYSQDAATRDCGGRLGLVGRADLTPALAAKVFQCNPPAVLGPVKESAGYRLLLVEEIPPTELTESVKETIGQRIFEEWCQRSLNANVRIAP